MPDYDDPEIEAQWFAERREEVANYLSGENIAHGGIGNEPAWYCAPYVSIWAIEGPNNSGSIAWWCISGDLPHDYVSASEAKKSKRSNDCLCFIVARNSSIYGAR